VDHKVDGYTFFDKFSKYTNSTLSENKLVFCSFCHVVKISYARMYFFFDCSGSRFSEIFLAFSLISGGVQIMLYSTRLFPPLLNHLTFCHLLISYLNCRLLNLKKTSNNTNITIITIQDSQSQMMKIIRVQ